MKRESLLNKTHNFGCLWRSFEVLPKVSSTGWPAKSESRILVGFLGPCRISRILVGNRVKESDKS